METALLSKLLLVTGFTFYIAHFLPPFRLITGNFTA